MNINFNDQKTNFGMAHILRPSLRNLDSKANNALDKFIKKDLKSGNSLAKDIDFEYNVLPLSEHLTIIPYKIGQSKIARFLDRIIKENKRDRNETVLIPKPWIGTEQMENDLIKLKQKFLAKK